MITNNSFFYWLQHHGYGRYRKLYSRGQLEHDDSSERRTDRNRIGDNGRCFFRHDGSYRFIPAVHRVQLTDASGAALARQYLHAAGRTLEHGARLLRAGERRAGSGGSLAVTGQTRVVVQADVPPSGHFLSDHPATCGQEKKKKKQNRLGTAISWANVHNIRNIYIVRV